MLTHRRVLLTHTTGSLLVDFAVILPECLPDGSTNPRLPSSQARFQPTTSPWTGHLEYPILRRSRPAPSKFQPTFPIPIPVSRPLAVVGAERITFGFSSASDNAEVSHTRIMVNNSPVPPAVTHVTIHHETSLIIRTAASELNLTSIPVRTNRAEQSTNMLNKTTVPMTNKINFKVSSSTLSRQSLDKLQRKSALNKRVCNLHGGPLSTSNLSRNSLLCRIGQSYIYCTVPNGGMDICL